MRFFYIYPEELPSGRARTTSVVKSAETLSAHFPLTLICSKSAKSSKKERQTTQAAQIEEAYGADFSNVEIVNISKRFLFINSNRIFNYRLQNILPKDEPTIIYVRHLKQAAELLENRRKNWKIIFESHEIFHKTTINYDRAAEIREMERLVYTKADGLVFITEPLQHDVMEIFGSRLPSVALHLGVDLPPAIPQKDFSQIDEAFYIGSFQPWKGVDELIESFAKVDKNIKLTLIGNGNAQRKQELLERIARNHLQARVSLRPALSHAEIMLLLSIQTKLCILPNNMSPFERYTSPLKLFEYMGTNNIIVFSELSTLEDILAQGKIGVGFPPGNTPAMADAINAICENPAKHAHLAQNAFKAAQEHTWAKRADKLAGFIKALSLDPKA